MTENTGPDSPFSGPQNMPTGVVEAASWQLAGQLVAALPGSRVVELHPGDDQEDVLSVVSVGLDEPSVRIDINRAGGLTIVEAPHVPEDPAIRGEHLWSVACEPRGVGVMARHVVARAGLPWGQNRQGRRWIAYATFGSLLASRALDDTVWSVRSVLLDGSDGYAVRPGLQPDIADVWWLDPGDTWCVVADDEPVAWVWEAWLLRSNGERIDLAAMYSRGATIADLAAEVARRSRLASQALPARRPIPPEPAEYARPSAVAWLDWAGAYDAYRLLAGSPEALAMVLGPARSEYAVSGVVPEWCGPHLLRAWLFYLYRADHQSGGGLFKPGGEDTGEWNAVVAALTRR